MGCGASTPVAAAPSEKQTEVVQPSVEEKPVEVVPVEEKPVIAVDFKPIHSAIRWNKPIEEIEALLTCPEAVNCVDTNNGNYPIHIAAQNGHDDIIKLLIRKKANLDAKNGKGNTGIHMAVGYDYYAVAQMLIAAGADQTLPNDLGIPSDRGLEGDKCMGIAALVCAASGDEVKAALVWCDTNTDSVHKVNFISAGLKAKKNIGGEWTPEHQNLFKSITNRLS